MITLTVVITALTGSKKILRRYTLRVVTSTFIGHPTVLSGEGRLLILFPQRATKKTSKILSFQHEIYDTFSKLFHKSLTQHADSECNSTHSIQCGRVDFKKSIN